MLSGERAASTSTGSTDSGTTVSRLTQVPGVPRYRNGSGGMM